MLILFFSFEYNFQLIIIKIQYIYIYTHNIQFHEIQSVTMSRTKNLEYFISSFVPLRGTFYESSSQEMKEKKKIPRAHGTGGWLEGWGLTSKAREQTGGNLTYCYVLI